MQIKRSRVCRSDRLGRFMDKLQGNAASVSALGANRRSRPTPFRAETCPSACAGTPPSHRYPAEKPRLRPRQDRHESPVAHDPEGTHNGRLRPSMTRSGRDARMPSARRRCAETASSIDPACARLGRRIAAWRYDRRPPRRQIARRRGTRWRRAIRGRDSERYRKPVIPGA